MSEEEARAESIRKRLRNVVSARGEDVQFALQRYAAERFLFRLGESPHRERFVLKGATLFALWGGNMYRPTRDLDFTGYGSSEIDAVLAVFRDLCAMRGLDDGLVFDAVPLTAGPIREEAEYNGVRVEFQARLGESKIKMQIDIGFGNAIHPGAREVAYPTLLGHAAPRIRAYPQEAVVAEKFHALVVLGERNSRAKDFYDLCVLARQFPFSGATLAGAIEATFERRGTPIEGEAPVALTPRFYIDEAHSGRWRAYLSRNRLPGAPTDFAAAGELVRAFLLPPWQALASSRRFGMSWPPGGPWPDAASSAAHEQDSSS